MPFSMRPRRARTWNGVVSTMPEAQQILARDLPAINLWYRDTVVVHNRRLTNIVPTPSGSFTFLESARLAQ